MKNEDGRQALDKNLLGSSNFGAPRRVEVALHGLRLSETFEGIDDIIDLWRANVKLKRLVRLEGNRVFVSWHSKLGSEFATEYFRD